MVVFENCEPLDLVAITLVARGWPRQLAQAPPGLSSFSDVAA